MSIAQELCDEIVEPSLKRSTAQLALDADTSTHRKAERAITNTSSKQNSKVIKSIFIEKKKVLNKFAPHDIDSKSRTVIKQYKSKDNVRKKLADSAVNTFVTGPLRCDHDCVTLVRRRDRDNHSSCKHNSKLSAKQVQTFVFNDYSFADKACGAHYVGTANFGTQFMAKSGTLTSNRTRANLGNSTRAFHGGLIELHTPASIPIDNTPSLCYMRARRWALTKYPARGPDF